MNAAVLVRKRRGKYMAQLLEAFEDSIEDFVPPEAAEEFKAMVRRKMDALTTDAIEIMSLDGVELNGAGMDIQDRVFPDGRARPVPQT